MKARETVTVIPSGAPDRWFTIRAAVFDSGSDETIVSLDRLRKEGVRFTKYSEDEQTLYGSAAEGVGVRIVGELSAYLEVKGCRMRSTELIRVGENLAEDILVGAHTMERRDFTVHLSRHRPQVLGCTSVPLVALSTTAPNPQNFNELVQEAISVTEPDENPQSAYKIESAILTALGDPFGHGEEYAKAYAAGLYFEGFSESERIAFAKKWPKEASVIDLEPRERTEKNPIMPYGAKPSIWYFGDELHFKEEVDSIDEAQTILDGWKMRGTPAAALHERGKHQIYVARSGKNPRKTRAGKLDEDGKLHEIFEGHYYATKPSWTAEIGDKEVQLALYVEATDMYEATGEAEFKDCPWNIEASIMPAYPGPGAVRQSDSQSSDPAARLADVHGYFGGIPVTDVLMETSAPGGEVGDIKKFKRSGMLWLTREMKFGTVAARRGPGAEFSYPCFQELETAKAFANELLKRAPALFGLVGFTLDQPINLAGETGWDALGKLVDGAEGNPTDFREQVTMKDVGTGPKMSKSDFERRYVHARYPGLCGYAYRADLISVEEGKRAMSRILRNVKWIEDWPHGHPILHLKNGKRLFTQDSGDFPQPTSECDDGPEENPQSFNALVHEAIATMDGIAENPASAGAIARDVRTYLKRAESFLEEDLEAANDWYQMAQGAIGIMTRGDLRAHSKLGPEFERVGKEVREAVVAARRRLREAGVDPDTYYRTAKSNPYGNPQEAPDENPQSAYKIESASWFRDMLEGTIQAIAEDAPDVQSQLDMMKERASSISMASVESNPQQVESNPMSMRTTEWKEFREGGKRHRISAKYGLDEEFAKRNNQAPYFSATATIDEMRGGGWRDDSGGMLHTEIARHFRELAPYLKWHLVSTEGPLHYIANAKYWWEKVLGTSPWPSQSYDPDPLEAFKSTIVFGGVPGETLPSKTTSWPEVQAWLEARLPALMQNFRADMAKLGVSTE